MTTPIIRYVFLEGKRSHLRNKLRGLDCHSEEEVPKVLKVHGWDGETPVTTVMITIDKETRRV